MGRKKSISDIYEWRKLGSFVEGDFIRALDKDMFVSRVKVDGKVARIVYIDDGREKALVNPAHADYIAKKRDIIVEKESDEEV